MPTVIVRTVRLRISREKARRRLASIIARGERLRQRLEEYEHRQHPQTSQLSWQLWYGAFLAAARDIFPNSDVEDHLHRVQSASRVLSDRVQAVMDTLADYRDALPQYDQPAASSRLADVFRDSSDAVRPVVYLCVLVIFLVEMFTSGILGWILGLLSRGR